MPIPKPKGNEKQDQYISRCISKISSEYEQDQAAAICYSTWRESKKTEITKSILKNIVKLAKLKMERKNGSS